MVTVTSGPDSDTIQAANWAGCIPVILTLSSKSLSSPTIPPPIHVLVSRHTYLHLALEEAVWKLHEFAPMMTSSFLSKGGIVRTEPEPGTIYNDDEEDNDGNAIYYSQSSSEGPAAATATTKLRFSSSYPICWFEDEDTKMALRWHFFAGILFDMKQTKSIPWKIQLHFTSYPNNQILPLQQSQQQPNSLGGGVVDQVRHYYKNSLKQALCVQTGNSKAAMSITKENHGRLWDSVQTGNYGLYRLVSQQYDFFSSTTTPLRIPVRLFLQNNHYSHQPPMQKPCRIQPPQKDQGTTTTSDREFVMTLGRYFAQEVPDWFDEHGKPKEKASIDWIISGIHRPSVDTPMLQLWQDLSHPDRFLHIILFANKTTST